MHDNKKWEIKSKIVSITSSESHETIQDDNTTS